MQNQLSASLGVSTVDEGKTLSFNVLYNIATAVSGSATPPSQTNTNVYNYLGQMQSTLSITSYCVPIQVIVVEPPNTLQVTTALVYNLESKLYAVKPNIKWWLTTFLHVPSVL